jgi:hypothetical protein
MISFLATSGDGNEKPIAVLLRAALDPSPLRTGNGSNGVVVFAAKHAWKKASTKLPKRSRAETSMCSQRFVTPVGPSEEIALGSNIKKSGGSCPEKPGGPMGGNRASDGYVAVSIGGRRP